MKAHYSERGVLVFLSTSVIVGRILYLRRNDSIKRLSFLLSTLTDVEASRRAWIAIIANDSMSRANWPNAGSEVRKSLLKEVLTTSLHMIPVVSQLLHLTALRLTKNLGRDSGLLSVNVERGFQCPSITPSCTARYLAPQLHHIS